MSTFLCLYTFNLRRHSKYQLACLILPFTAPKNETSSWFYICPWDHTSPPLLRCKYIYFMPSCCPQLRIRLVLGNVTGSEFLLMVGSGSVHDESDPIQILKRVISGSEFYWIGSATLVLSDQAHADQVRICNFSYWR